MPYETVQGADIYSYLTSLQLEISQFTGKWILDLGAGERQFALGVIKSRIKARVISLEPDFAIPERKQYLDLEALEHKRRLEQTTVAGLGEALPFRDGSFDLVLAYRILQWARNFEAMEQILSETVRVLKPKGEARFAHMGTVGRTRTNEVLVRQEKIVGKLSGIKSRFLPRNRPLLVLKKA